MKNKLKAVSGNTFKSITRNDIYYIIIINSIIFLINFDSIDFDIYKYINNTFIEPSNVLEILIFSLHKFYLLYIIGKILDIEFSTNNIYFLFRHGNKKRYFCMISKNIFNICIGYYITAIIIPFILSNIFTRECNCTISLNCLILLGKTLCTSYLMFIIYLIIFFILNNKMASFIINIFLIYVLLIIYNILQCNYKFYIGIFIFNLFGLIFAIKHLKKIDIYRYLK